MTQNSLTSANYGPASPFLGRSRFSVIPEEPHGSPSQGATLTDKEPSPEWDFDDDKKVVSQTKISFLHEFYHLASFTSFYAVCETKNHESFIKRLGIRYITIEAFNNYPNTKHVFRYF